MFYSGEKATELADIHDVIFLTQRQQVRDAHVDAREGCATAYGWFIGVLALQWVCSTSKIIGKAIDNEK